jgi:predicted dehydrogenase
MAIGKESSINIRVTPNDITFRIGLVGCGAVTQIYYAPAIVALAKEYGLTPRISVRSLFDPDDGNRRQLSLIFPDASAYADWNAFRGTDLDLAIVASPPRYHAEQTIELLNAGVPVLCEKPLAVQQKDAICMVDTAERQSVVLAAGMIRRFLPATRTIQKILSRQVLGAVQSFQWVEASLFRWPISSLKYFDKQNSGGGVLFDIGIHVLDLLTWWLGDLQLLTYRDDAMGGIETNCVVTLRTGRGADVTVCLSRDSGPPTACRIECEHGVITWRDGHATEFELESIDGLNGESQELIGKLVAQPDTPRTFERAFVSQLENVVSTICAEQSLAVDARSTLRSLELIEACYSIRELIAMPWLRPEESGRAHELAEGR